MDSKTSMASARLTVIAIALVGIALAWNPDSSVFTIVSFAWAGFGASFGPVMLFALFWKRSNLQGCLLYTSSRASHLCVGVRDRCSGRIMALGLIQLDLPTNRATKGVDGHS